VAQLDAEAVELGDVVELGRWASPGAPGLRPTLRRPDHEQSV